MRLSSILVMIIVMDMFAFFGVGAYNDIKGLPGFDQIGVNNSRPISYLMGYNATDGTLTAEPTWNIFDELSDFGSGVALAILDATGLTNLASQVWNAFELFKQILGAPFQLGDLIGSNTIWFVGSAINLMYTTLLLLAIIAAWKGGEI